MARKRTQAEQGPEQGHEAETIAVLPAVELPEPEPVAPPPPFDPAAAEAAREAEMLRRAREREAARGLNQNRAWQEVLAEAPAPPAEEPFVVQLHDTGAELAIQCSGAGLVARVRAAALARREELQEAGAAAAAGAESSPESAHLARLEALLAETDAKVARAQAAGQAAKAAVAAALARGDDPEVHEREQQELGRVAFTLGERLPPLRANIESARFQAERAARQARDVAVAEVRVRQQDELAEAGEAFVTELRALLEKYVEVVPVTGPPRLAW